MNLVQFIFYIFSALLIMSSLAVILSRNPVRGVLFLVFAFIMSAGIWIILQAEFLGLVLILVYVGAVMTLFLFVVMMLNIEKLPPRTGVKKYWPYGILILLIIVGVTCYVIGPEHFALAAGPAPGEHSADYSNVNALGMVIYTKYVYAFEVAAVILLVAIVAAISLAFRGWAGLSKRQNIAKQVQTTPEERIRMVK
jgi:NADH-quinone oxidoreductase subunit J